MMTSRFLGTALRWVAMLAIVAGALLSAVAPASAADATIHVLVVDGDTGEMTVLDGNTGVEMSSFSAPAGGFAPAYATDDGRYFLVNHMDGDATTILESGLSVEPHGDHVHVVTGAPFVRSTITLGTAPSHAWAHDGVLAIAYDGDGTVAIVDHASLETGATATVFPVAQEDHASIATIDDTLLVGYYQLGRIDAYGVDGAVIEENLIGCPGTHGEAKLGDTIAFACEDGIALVSDDGDTLSAAKVPYANRDSGTPEASVSATPATDPAPERANLLAAHEASPVIVGDLPTGLALIDPVRQTVDAMSLPSQPLWMEFTSDGQSVVVLTADGTLRAIDPVTREELWSAVVTTPYTSFDPEEANALYPFISVAGGKVFVPDPAVGEVVAVDAASGEIVDRFEVGGRPARVVAVSATGVEH